MCSDGFVGLNHTYTGKGFTFARNLILERVWNWRIWDGSFRYIELLMNTLGMLIWVWLCLLGVQCHCGGRENGQFAKIVLNTGTSSAESGKTSGILLGVVVNRNWSIYLLLLLQNSCSSLLNFINALLFEGFLPLCSFLEIKVQFVNNLLHMLVRHQFIC